MLGYRIFAFVLFIVQIGISLTYILLACKHNEQLEYGNCHADVLSAIAWFMSALYWLSQSIPNYILL